MITMLLVLILQLSLAHLKPAEEEVRQMRPPHTGCQCGLADDGHEKDLDDIDQEDEKKEHTRIVSGYEPLHRPWMVYIQIMGKKGDNESFGICGGALINRLWLISAAHCFCLRISCILNNKGNPVVNFEPKDNVRCVMGVKDVSLAAQHSELVHTPNLIVIHPHYNVKVSLNNHHDVALIRLSKPLKISQHLMPICLPFGSNFPDAKGRVVVAGWGALHDLQCTTTEHGPSPFKRCRFPFFFKGFKFSHCNNMLSPSAYNPVCSHFLTHSKPSDQPNGNNGLNRVVIEDKQGQHWVDCYKKYGTMGWCGTCIDDAREGQMGFCGQGYEQLDKKHPQQIVNVTANANWGFCSSHCINSNPISDVLQETKLDIVPQKECSRLAHLELKPHPTLELCAGHVIRRRQRRFSLNVTKDTFDLSGSEVKAIDNSSTTDIFFGGQDACIGDSGGPLWRWMGKRSPRAFIIGVVSRGKGCARKDFPGIYTRVKKFIGWIRHHIKDGDC